MIASVALIRSRRRELRWPRHLYLEAPGGSVKWKTPADSRGFAKFMPILKSLKTAAAFVMMAASLPVALFAQQTDSLAAAPPDPHIAQALREVSPARIQQTIEKLVSFHTRQTLSSDMPPTNAEGINAAADWIQGELQRYSSQCGDCLEVKTDQFIQQPASRVPQSTSITNVYAILKGTDPANAGRIYVVTGHYDSRNSDTNDAKGAAPGANDDASGTAVSLECARVLSKHRFPPPSSS